MSNEHNIVPLTFPGSGEKVRVVWINGDPWFVAADICREIGLSQVSKAVKQLVIAGGSTRTPHTMQAPNGGTYQAEILIVNEAGMYEMVISSRKPGAKIFRKWIFGEVIPTIRKTGFYETAEHRKSRVLDLASRMDPDFRAIDAAKRRKEIPHNLVRHFARINGIMMETVGFPEVMKTSGEIDDENGVGKNRKLRLRNGTHRSRMYKIRTGKFPYKVPSWRSNEFRIVNQFPKDEVPAIKGFCDKQITSDHVKAIEQ